MCFLKELTSHFRFKDELTFACDLSPLNRLTKILRFENGD